MEILSATVKNDGDKYFLTIGTENQEILIPMSDDKPNDVKSAFNKIIARIKLGSFQIKLEKVGDDLFSLVAAEYLIQLNREIKEVRGEMEKYKLVE